MIWDLYLFFLSFLNYLKKFLNPECSGFWIKITFLRLHDLVLERIAPQLAITTLYDKLLNNLNEKKISFLLFLDLKKAFDSISQSILLRKLYLYVFWGPSFNLLQSYLTNRSICTKMDGKLSKPISIQYGIPQESVLGLLLFLIFVNDFPNVSKFDTTLFSDDTNFHLSHYNINIL